MAYHHSTWQRGHGAAAAATCPALGAPGQARWRDATQQQQQRRQQQEVKCSSISHQPGIYNATCYSGLQHPISPAVEPPVHGMCYPVIAALCARLRCTLTRLRSLQTGTKDAEASNAYRICIANVTCELTL
jgi:hypothetical protein